MALLHPIFSDRNWGPRLPRRPHVSWTGSRRSWVALLVMVPYHIDSYCTLFLICIYIITFWICVSTLNVFKRGPFSKHVGIVSTLDVTIVQKNQPAIVSYMVELVHGSENLSNSFHNWCFCSKNLEHAHDFEQLFEQLEQFSANCHKWYISKHVLSIWTYSLKMFRLRAIVPTARWEPTKLEACYPKTMYGKEMMGTHFVCKTWEIFMQPGI